jgi:O-antigen ligase
MKIPGAFLREIRILWTAGFSLLLLLNLDQFGISSGLGPAPKYWSVGLFLVTAFFFLPGFKPTRLLRVPLFWWTLGYLLLSILWVGPADNMHAAQEGLVLVVTTCLYTGTALLAYPHVAQSHRIWRLVLWIALSLAVLSIVQEYFNPAAYVFAAAGQGIHGRAAGLYLNPNIAAQALVMILACLMIRGSARANFFACGLALVGLFLTFSRGGLITWAMLVIAATIRGRLSRWFLLVIALCVAIILVAGPQVLDALSYWISPENRNSLDRLAWLLGQGGLNDHSAGKREYLAAYAWQQFLQAPLLGHGLGYSWVWGVDVASHNLILRHLVEYGLIGVLIFPLFLYCSIRSAPDGNNRDWRWLVGGLVLLLSMFTHNMLEQANFLLPWLAICLMPSARAEPSVERESQ